MGVESPTELAERYSYSRKKEPHPEFWVVMLFIGVVMFTITWMTFHP